MIFKGPFWLKPFCDSMIPQEVVTEAAIVQGVIYYLTENQ